MIKTHPFGVSTPPCCSVSSGVNKIVTWGGQKVTGADKFSILFSSLKNE